MADTQLIQLNECNADARAAVLGAQTLADARQHPEVRPLHLLHALTETSSAFLSQLEREGVSAEDVLVECELWLRRFPVVEGVSAYVASRTLALLDDAVAAAKREGHMVGVHELVAAFQGTEGAAKEVLSSLGVTLNQDGAVVTRAAPARVAPQAAPTVAAQSYDIRARQTAFALGRGDVLRRALLCLARDARSNVCLVGEPGGGRDGLIATLMERAGQDDSFLSNAVTRELDGAALLAGVRLKGEAAERLRKTLADANVSGRRLLLVLKHATHLFKRSPEAAVLLANHCRRRDTHLVLAATYDEAQKLYADHATLMDEVARVDVEPATPEQALETLRAIAPLLEQAHGVDIADESLQTAVQLSRRHLAGVPLPLAAVTLIDDVSARHRMALEGEPEQILIAVDTLRRLNDERDASLADTHAAGRDVVLESLTSARDDAEEGVRASRAAWQEERTLHLRLRSMRDKLRATPNDASLRKSYRDEIDAAETQFLSTVVGAHDVADVIAQRTGIPASRMLADERERLLSMEDSLSQRVIGQDPAVSALSRAVRRSRVGLRDPKRPIGSFLFLGPSGVGKTELTKALADFLFDDRAALVRLDMSEFMEKHMVARLLGSPPGYADSEDGGFLTEAVRQRPYSVVLFDEMEKAHADVFNILLQVLDDGRLTDSRGRLARFQDTIVVMTSNVGSELILEGEMEPEALRERIDDALRSHYRPEFLNRIDEIVIFNPLSKLDLAKIAALQLGSVRKRLATQNSTFTWSEELPGFIAEEGYEPAFGARPLRRVIQRRVLDPLAMELMRAGAGASANVFARVQDGDVVFRIEPV